MPSVQARGGRQRHDGAKAGQHLGPIPLKEAPAAARKERVPAEQERRRVALCGDKVAHVPARVAGRVQRCEGDAAQLKDLPVVQEEGGRVYAALLQRAARYYDARPRSCQLGIATRVVLVVVRGEGAAELQGGREG